MSDPLTAAKDADLILYKLRGVTAPTNMPLSDAIRARLDATTLSQLLALLKVPGGAEAALLAGAGGGGGRAGAR